MVAVNSRSIREGEEIQERLIKLTVFSNVTKPSSSCKVEMKSNLYLSLLSKLIFGGKRKKGKSELVVERDL
jgi:hypothetical protein